MTTGKKQTDEKLSKYGLSAAAVLAGAAGADGAIQYTPVYQVLDDHNEYASIVMGGNEVFHIGFRDWGSQRELGIYAINQSSSSSNGSWVVKSSSNYNARGFSSGDYIDGSLSPWHTRTNFQNTNQWSYPGCPGCVWEDFYHVNDKYYGVRFQNGGNTHYGWIQVSSTDALTRGYVVGYAWETDAGVGIEAGAGGDGPQGDPPGGAVPEPLSLAAIALGAAGVGAYARRRRRNDDEN